jgi:hypothetical protein
VALPEVHSHLLNGLLQVRGEVLPRDEKRIVTQ